MGTGRQAKLVRAQRLAALGMVAFALAVRLFICLPATYALRHVHGVQAATIGRSVTVAAAHFFVLKTAATAPYDGRT
jgi:hypothetical protein